MSDFTKAVAVAKSYTDKHGGGVPEAPNDGKTYGRKNKAWAEITGGGGVDYFEVVSGKLNMVYEEVE